jgi:hypothetical protein
VTVPSPGRRSCSATTLRPERYYREEQQAVDLAVDGGQVRGLF